MERFLTWLCGILFVFFVVKAYWWDRLPKEEPEQTIIKYSSPADFHSRLSRASFGGR